MPTSPLKSASFEALADQLLWQQEMGVNELTETTPQWPQKAVGSGLSVVGGSATTKPLLHKTTTHHAPPTTHAIAGAIAEARALADAAKNLAELEAAVRGFNGCALKKTATNTVFCQGVAESRIMFIGEAPGADEDRQGVPFCGKSGQLLDLMLSHIGLKRAENFYITNTLFWRPPGNRQPTPEELDICRPFVEKHIALIDPKLMVLLGGTATKAILGKEQGITRLRGQVFSYKNNYLEREVPVHVIYHPSYLLRNPIAKKQTWADLLALKKALAM